MPSRRAILASLAAATVAPAFAGPIPQPYYFPNGSRGVKINYALPAACDANTKAAVDTINAGDPFGLNDNGLPTLGSPISPDAIEEYNISTANYDVTSRRGVGATRTSAGRVSVKLMVATALTVRLLRLKVSVETPPALMVCGWNSLVRSTAPIAKVKRYSRVKDDAPLGTFHCAAMPLSVAAFVSMALLRFPLPVRHVPVVMSLRHIWRPGYS